MIVPIALSGGENLLSQFLFIYLFLGFVSFLFCKDLKLLGSRYEKKKKKGNRSMPTCDICYFVKWKRWRNRGKGFLFKTAEKYSILVDLWSWMEIFESNIIITPSLLIIHGNRSNAFWSYFIFSIFMMNGEKIKSLWWLKFMFICKKTKKRRWYKFLMIKYPHLYLYLYLEMIQVEARGRVQA